MVRFFYYTIPCWKSRRVGVLGRGKGFLYLMWFLPRSKGILSPASEKGANRLTRLRPWDGQDTKRASRPFIFQIQHIPFRNLLHLMFLFSLLTSYHGKFRLANKKRRPQRQKKSKYGPMIQEPPVLPYSKSDQPPGTAGLVRKAQAAFQIFQDGLGRILRSLSVLLFSILEPLGFCAL